MTDQVLSRQFMEKHHEYRMKAREASEPNTRAAFEAVAREFLRRATSAASQDDAPRYSVPKR
jgi:hypothetical protein